MPAPQKETQAKGERAVETKYFRTWKGVYTKAKRAAIPEDRFYDLTNLIPIGDANLHTINDISSSLVDYTTDTVYWIQYANINSKDYIFSFTVSGAIYAYDIAAATSAQINSSNLLSGSGTRMDQWKNQRVLFADTTGYYDWNGTTFTGPITGGHAADTSVVSATISGSVGTILFLKSPTDLFNGAVVQALGFTPSGWNGKYPVTQLVLPAVSSALINTAFTLGTITFASAHGLATSALVTFTGFVSTGWNATFTATVTGTTTITIPLTAAPTITLPSISNGTAVGTTGTLTFLTPHGLTTGQYITLFNMNPTGWNGQWQVTVTNSTQCTVTLPSSPSSATSPYGTAVVSSATTIGTITVGNMWQTTFASPPATATVIGTINSPGLLPQNATTPYAQYLTSPDIAVFSNRVWIYSDRALYVSGIDSYTDFTIDAGSVVQQLTDPQIRGQLTRMLSSNGYLYLLAKSSIFVISDVYIPANAVPPAPVFSVLNVQAIIGCDQPGSVFTMNRELMFANSYGIYKLAGVTAEKISDDIDGTFQYVVNQFGSGGLQISGGGCSVKNILNASFLIRQIGDPDFGTRTIIANYFDSKWWFANYNSTLTLNSNGVASITEATTNTLTFITWGMNGSLPALYGIKGNKLYQLYSNTSTGPLTRWVTALWPMEDSLADKEVYRAGLEITATAVGNVYMSLDTPNASNQFLVGTPGAVAWVNNSGALTSWINNSSSIVTWSNSSYSLFLADAQGGYGKYVGLTGYVNSGADYELNGNMMDYALRRRW